MLTTDKTGYPSIDKPWLKYYSEEVLQRKPFEGTLYEYMKNATSNTGHKYCLNYMGRRISYDEFYNKIDETAIALKAIGVKKGDIISICILTIPENYYLLYAANKIGAVCNYVAVNNSVDEIRKRVKSVGSKFVFTIDLAEQNVVEAVGNETDVKIISIPLASSMPFVLATLVKLKSRKRTYSSRVVKWSDFIKTDADSDYVEAVGHADDPAIIEYTSGTTGESKGALHTNRTANQLAFNYANLGDLLVFDKNDRFLNILPPFYAYGIFVGTHMPICLGLEVCLSPNPDPKAVAKDFLRYKPNHFTGGPKHIDAIVELPKVQKMNLSFLKTAGFGGDSVSQGWLDNTNKFLAEHRVPNKLAGGYGMTEVAGTFCVANHKVEEMIPFPNNNLMILDEETGEEKKIGEEGEVYLSGPTLMQGYYLNDGQTNEAIVELSGSRWLRTEDLGYVTESGGLVISGRLKRIYWTVTDEGVFRVYPMKIEKLLDSHENVNRSAVVGIPNQEKGYLSFAVLVLENRTDEKSTIAELKALCEKLLDSSSWPLEYRIVDGLPMTPAGKVDYKKIEDMIINQE